MSASLSVIQCFSINRCSALQSDCHVIFFRSALLQSKSVTHSVDECINDNIYFSPILFHSLVEFVFIHLQSIQGSQS